MNDTGGAETASPAIRSIGSIDPNALKIPAHRAASSLFRHFFTLIFTLNQNKSLHQFVQESIQPGNVVHTDGWSGYSGLSAKGYVHNVTVLKGKNETASELLPRVHLVISLLKRWLMGTHQGTVSHKHLDYYLDEFTFRFNRRNSKSRGKLFFRLLQQAVAVEPVPYEAIIHRTRGQRKKARPQAIGAT